MFYNLKNPAKNNLNNCLVKDGRMDGLTLIREKKSFETGLSDLKNLNSWIELTVMNI